MTLWFLLRVTEDGDPYVRPEDENYEEDSVRQLETELQMEEYLKQKLQDEAYQVRGASAPLNPHSCCPGPVVGPLHSSENRYHFLPSTNPFLEYSDCLP